MSAVLLIVKSVRMLKKQQANGCLNGLGPATEGAVHIQALTSRTAWGAVGELRHLCFLFTLTSSVVCNLTGRRQE